MAKHEPNHEHICLKCGRQQSYTAWGWRCKPCRQAAARERHARNPEKRRRAARCRYARNPEKRRAALRESRAQNPEKWHEYSIRSSRRHIEKMQSEYGIRDAKAVYQCAAKSVATNHYQKWTDEEDRSLVRYANSGMTYYQIAIVLGRTLRAVGRRLSQVRKAECEDANKEQQR